MLEVFDRMKCTCVQTVFVHERTIEVCAAAGLEVKEHGGREGGFNTAGWAEAVG